MKKLFAFFLFSAALASSANADDVFMLEEALELHAKQVRFSLAGAGSISVRECRECSPTRLPLMAETVYFANGDRITRERFAELSRLGGAVYVFYSTDTGKVTRMRLDSPFIKSDRARQ